MTRREEKLTPIGTGEGYVPRLTPQSARQQMPGPGGANRVFGTLLLIAVALGVCAFAWTRMCVVDIEVNGTRQPVPIGTTIDRIVQSDDIAVNAGTLLSVTGHTLEQGQGDPYDVEVNGADLGYDRGSAYRIQGDEQVSIKNGEDKTEDTQEEEVTVAPKLVFDGNAGAISYVSQWGTPTVKKVKRGVQSGETVDEQIKQQGQDTVIAKTNITPFDGQKLVALTFDDGPSKYTQQYLRILKDHGATATFFNLGQKADKDPSDAQAIADAGCELASHTYSHMNLPKQDADTIKSELTKAFDSIASATGVTTSMFRPPYGAFTGDCWIESGGVASVSVIWSKDSEDWHKPGFEKIVSNATDNIRSGDIILMHDGGGNRDEDVEALPKIIDTLHNAGYTFVTVSDLMKSGSMIPADIAVGTETMPSWAVWPNELG
ncbi:polysaccharide deacetylase family protein [Atopobiaceae bacterium HCP3S3_A4]